MEQVDTRTIVLGRGLRPVRFRIRAANREDEDHGKGVGTHASSSVLEFEFPRRDVLRLLPKLKLTAPLATGDKLELLAYGKLKDGTRVTAKSSVSVTGDQDVKIKEENEEKDRHKRQPDND